MIISTLVALLAAVSSACAEPLVSPNFLHVGRPASAEVRCDFQRPLLDCRVRVRHQGAWPFDELLDFSEGPRSASVGLRDSDGDLRANASYAGDGLAGGHCGVALDVKRFSLLARVECRGRTEVGGWSRGLATMLFDTEPVLAHTSPTPRLVVVAPGSDVAVLFRAAGALSRCLIATPAAGDVDLTPGESAPSRSRYRLHGAGMGQGECGYMLPNVTWRDAGFWSWEGWQNRSVAFQSTVVVVSVAPEAGPVLTVRDPASLRVGCMLTATCRAPPGAPPANLTWLLDGRVVRRDDGNDSMPALDVWQPMAVVQTLTLQLKEDDVGKRLECRADHQVGSWNASDSFTVAVLA